MPYLPQRFTWSARHYRPVVAFCVGLVLAVLLANVSGVPIQEWRTQPSATSSAAVVEPTAPTSTQLILPAAAPERLHIPRLALTATFTEALGLNEDRTIEVPESFASVGWYRYGPTPGELGPAVVLGHVDSYRGPAVFYSLGQLRPGDEIRIDRADGTTATFAVTRLARHAQSAFPTAAVYGDIDHAGLRLITCSGTYDRGTLRYSHNLIVYAELVAVTTAQDATPVSVER